MELPAWHVQRGEGPLVAAAIHHGHAVRPELVDLLAIRPAERLREEDPYTGDWTSVAPTRIVGLRSRFEVDLNRPRDRAVYLREEDAWGLRVWKRPPGPDVIARSRAIHDAFYREARSVLAELSAGFGRVVVLDLHSYNHRRNGPQAPADDPQISPDVNVGTSNMDRVRWDPVIRALIEALRGFPFPGRRLDVRENVRFSGGHFSRWVHDRFPETACSIAIEVKKVFMDEWTGEADPIRLAAVREALRLGAERVAEVLPKC